MAEEDVRRGILGSAVEHVLQFNLPVPHGVHVHQEHATSHLRLPVNVREPVPPQLPQVPAPSLHRLAGFRLFTRAHHVIFHSVPELRQRREDLIVHRRHDVLGVPEVGETVVPCLGYAEVVRRRERHDLPLALLVERGASVGWCGCGGHHRGPRGWRRLRRRLRGLQLVLLRLRGRLLVLRRRGRGLGRIRRFVSLRLAHGRRGGGRLDDLRGLGRVGILERDLARGSVSGPPPVAHLPVHAERGGTDGGAAARRDRRRRAEEDLSIEKGVEESAGDVGKT